MGLLSFIQDAGEKLFGSGEAKAAEPTSGSDSAANSAAANAIKDYIHSQKLDAKDLQVAFNPTDSSVTVGGEAADQETREKIVLCCGNVAGVGQVHDELTVASPTEESSFHTVVKGDTLSKIAKTVYGNAMKYPVIFEANKPMLKDPDKIYPGQVLRIPPLPKA